MILLFFGHIFVPSPPSPAPALALPVSCCAKCEGFSILSKSGSSGSSPGSTWVSHLWGSYGPWEGWWNLRKWWKKSGCYEMSWRGNMWGNGWKLRLGPWISTREAIGNWDGHDFNSFLMLDISGTIPCIQWHKHDPSIRSCMTQSPLHNFPAVSKSWHCSIWHHFAWCFLPCCIWQLNQAIENITKPYIKKKNVNLTVFIKRFPSQKNPNILRLVLIWFPHGLGNSTDKLWEDTPENLEQSCWFQHVGFNMLKPGMDQKHPHVGLPF